MEYCMIITDIVEVNIGRSKTKIAYKIFIDDIFAFLLYSQDLKQYQIQQGEEITSDIYERIIEDIVFRRAKQKALTMLSHSDKTENEIIENLKEAHYSQEIIQRTIEYLKEYKYLDEERLARNFIRFRKEKHSRLALETKLIQKGINKRVLDKVIAEEYEISDENEDPEILAINKLISKKYENLTNLTWEEKQKLINFLYRRGFNLDKIHKCL